MALISNNHLLRFCRVFAAVLLLLTAATLLWAEDISTAPQDDAASYLIPTLTTSTDRSSSGVKEACSLFYTVYRNTLSKVRGGVCAFSPSCSHYSEEAIEQEGFVKGVIMTTERLERCSCCIIPSYYPRGMVQHNGRSVYDDPVEDHDFWNGFTCTQPIEETNH